MVYDGYGGYSCSQRVRWSLRRYSMVSLHKGWYLLGYGGGGDLYSGYKDYAAVLLNDGELLD